MMCLVHEFFVVSLNDQLSNETRFFSSLIFAWASFGQGVSFISLTQLMRYYNAIHHLALTWQVK